MIGKRVIANIEFDDDTNKEVIVTIIDTWETALGGKKYLAYDRKKALYVVGAKSLIKLT